MMELHTDREVDAFKTLQTLIKYNNGVFKSQKQANFIMSGAMIDVWSKSAPLVKMDEDEIRWVQCEGRAIVDRDETIEEAYERHIKEADIFFNIKLQPGQHLISIEGYIRWADYGRRSKRRVGFMYVIDNNGIVARYKMHYKYTDGGASSVNRDATEVDWKRPLYVQLPGFQSLEAAEEEKKKQQEAALEGQSYIGEVKQRLIFEGVVERIIDMGTGSFGYNQVYLKEWSIIKTAEGHTVVVHKWIAEIGETVKFKATVESHDAYKGVKQTHVTRVAML